MREFELLDHVYAASASLAQADGALAIGPGDDMAMLCLLGGQRVLAAVDQLVAGRHVDLATTPLELVGRKAIARSVSDIAAMATQPLAALVAVTLPPDFGESRARELFDAMRHAAEEFDCPLVGGDIAIHSDASHPLVCAVTVLSQPVRQPVELEPITRSGAKPGDALYVTGSLGGSFEAGGGGRHLTFTPRVKHAIELATILRERLHAMIDVSDGLGRDAMHLAECSQVAIELDASTIPCHDGLDWRRAVSDGEDYELCFAACGEVPQHILDVPVKRIGKVTALASGEKPRCIVRDGEQAFDASNLGWQHES